MDVSSLKVTELRRELRSRGLSAAGDKAELSARLRAAVEAETDALEDELDLTALDDPETDEPEPEPETVRAPTSVPEADVGSAPAAAKKIVLNRTPLPPAELTVQEPTTPTTPTIETTVEATPKPPTPPPPSKKPVVDSKTKLEMRARRFGLPPSTETLKEARKARFGTAPAAKTPDMEALMKRAERFGTAVSKTLVQSQNDEKLLRRKERFGIVNS